MLYSIINYSGPTILRLRKVALCSLMLEVQVQKCMKSNFLTKISGNQGCLKMKGCKIEGTLNSKC